MDADVIKREFEKDMASYVAGEVFSQGAIVGVLKKHCRSDSDYRMVLKALTGKTSSKLLTPEEWLGLLRFVQPNKPEGGKWGSARGDELTSMCSALILSLVDVPEQMRFA